jgi:hypothetical protein
VAPSPYLEGGRKFVEEFFCQAGEPPCASRMRKVRLLKVLTDIL